MNCSKCNQDKPSSEFRRGRICNDCAKQYDETHRPMRYAKNAEIQRRKRAERHAAIDTLKSVPCADCKETFPPYVMDFDHRDPSKKNFEISQTINKTSTPWSLILEEISKCDVVCVRCHRLRTWKPGISKRIDRRRELIIELKSRPCQDCLKTYHFCQMDFDHVRGDKLGQVPKMRTRESILTEAAKCDVICANCHRERTQKLTPTPRLALNSVDMLWKNRRKGSLQTQIAPSSPRVLVPVYRPWHNLVGTTLDKDVAELFHISLTNVCLYRKKIGLPRFKKVPMKLKVDPHEKELTA